MCKGGSLKLREAPVTAFIPVVWDTSQCVYTSCLGHQSVCLWQLFGAPLCVFIPVVWGTTRCVYTSCLGHHSVCLYQLFGGISQCVYTSCLRQQSVCLQWLFGMSASMLRPIVWGTTAIIVFIQVLVAPVNVLHQLFGIPVIMFIPVLGGTS